MPEVTNPETIKMLNALAAKQNAPQQTAQPVMRGAPQPIIATPAQTPEEEARKAREAQLKEEAAARAAAGEARAQAEFEGTGGKPTEAQQKTGTLLTRIKGGFADIQAVRARNPEAQEAGLSETISRGIFGEGLITRKISGADRRIVTDAQRDVLDALLTLGTGAAYNAEQLEGQTLSYFPQYGDSAEEVQTKNLRLQRLIESAKINAGPKWAEVEAAIAPFMPKPPGAPVDAAAPTGTGLRVAEGEEYSTDTDIALARRLSEAWQSGAPIEQLNAISVEVTGSPLSQQALDTLAVDPDRKLSFTPARSGKREGGAPGSAAAIGAGLLKGYTGNLAEEAVGLISPDAAAKLQAAGEYAQEQAPVTTFLSELAGGVVSPLARLPLGKAGTVAGEAMRGAAYGGLYGAGEADPNAGLVERLPGALLGGVTGGIGGAAGGALAQRLGARGGPGGGAADEAAPTAIIPPAPSQLNKPRIPTATEMKRFSSVQNVDLSNARRGQDVYDWTANKAGDYAEPLIEGYGDIPVGVRLENGEVVVFDGNHRVALALGKNQREMPMHVIDAKNFDPENMGRKPVSPRQEMSDEELLAELGVPVTPAIDNIVPGAIGEVPTPAAAGEMEAIVDLARKATGSGPGNRAAKRELAKMAKINPAAQEAADRLGISLPPDVLSDNAQLLSLTGLARSQVGSEAETAWIKASRDAIERSEEALAELGAQKGLAEVSEAVSQKINATMTGLETQASALRKEVEAALDPQGRVEATNLQRSLASVINDLGGIGEAKQAMSGEERKLLSMLGEGETAKAPTYARLNLIRDQIGEALNKGRGPWVDTAERNLRKYYGALAEDQIQHIERVGGKEIADKQRAANSLFRDMYEKRQELVNLFGRDLDKGLAPLIRRVVTTGAKGDTAALNKALANIPKDMHGKVLMSGILAESMGRGGMGGFSFNNFAKTYRGLRENPTIYKQVAKAIGPKGDQTLIDLYAISRRMVEAENKVLKTGKANQALIGQLNADALLKKVIKGPATRLTSVTVGASAGDVTGAAAGSVINEIIERAGGTVRSDKLHRLLASDEFRGLMEKVALGEATDSAANKLAGSKSFIEYAKGLPIPKDFKSRAAWIKSAFSQTGANAAPEPQTIQLEARQ